jgi:hypothetical protein
MVKKCPYPKIRRSIKMVEKGKTLDYVYFFLYDRFSIQNRGVIPRVARGGCKFSFINVDRERVL